MRFVDSVSLLVSSNQHSLLQKNLSITNKFPERNNFFKNEPTIRKYSRNLQKVPPRFNFTQHWSSKKSICKIRNSESLPMLINCTELEIFVMMKSIMNKSNPKNISRCCAKSFCVNNVVVCIDI